MVRDADCDKDVVPEVVVEVVIVVVGVMSDNVTEALCSCVAV